MAAEGEEGPRLGTTHPYLGPFVRFMHTTVEGPVLWFRSKVESARTGEQPVWYHRQFQRVTSIEDCDVSDMTCRFEANQQFLRDWMVEAEMLGLLRQRMNDCFFYEKGTGVAHMQAFKVHPIIDLDEGSQHVCKPLFDTYTNAAKNYFIKYGELGVMNCAAERALMKQKHRLMWERRHGEVGSGMKTEAAAAAAE